MGLLPWRLTLDWLPHLFQLTGLVNQLPPDTHFFFCIRLTTQQLSILVFPFLTIFHYLRSNYVRMYVCRCMYSSKEAPPLIEAKSHAILGRERKARQITTIIMVIISHKNIIIKHNIYI